MQSRRVTIMGLGHFGGGVAVARWLARRGAQVTVTDLADADRLADAIAALRGEPVEFHLGGHREDDFRHADLVVVNPAVRPDDPLVRLAAESGASVTSEIELFLQACRAPVIAITGTNGKSTTAAMTAAILAADGRKTWLGGNIGRSLIEQLDEIASGDWVVLELSSFQLWHLGANARGPDVAIVTNCVPNHLNWHPDFAHYAAAKQRILRLQPPGGVAVLNPADAEVCRWTHLVRGRQIAPLADALIPRLQVPGRHNRVNAACAAAAATAIGCNHAAIEKGLGRFTGLEQRLERVAAIAGRRFYNDSSATTPESTIEALRSLAGPVWLLAGGSDKGANLEPMLDAIASQTRGAAFFGAVGPRLHERLRQLSADAQSTYTPRMADALAWCWERSRPGEIILLSPGFSSHDQFINYRQRGKIFCELVRALGPDAPGGRPA